MVLLHGLADYALEWGAVIAGLRDEHRVVAIEQRGHGSSTRRPDDVSRAAYVADAAAGPAAWLEGWADGLDQRADGLWPQWDAATLATALAQVAPHEHFEEWSVVEAPTLLLRGEHGSVPERQVESRCELRLATQLAVIAGAGHDLHLEAPDALLPVLRRLLADD